MMCVYYYTKCIWTFGCSDTHPHTHTHIFPSSLHYFCIIITNISLLCPTYYFLRNYSVACSCKCPVRICFCGYTSWITNKELDMNYNVHFSFCSWGAFSHWNVLWEFFLWMIKAPSYRHVKLSKFAFWLIISIIFPDFPPVSLSRINL